MNHLEVYRFVESRLAPIELTPSGKPGDEEPTVKEIPAIPCDSFKDLIEVYESELHLTQDIRDCLATMLAVVISTTTHGGQLGLRVIGRPGSAKSTLAEAISAAREYVYPRSKFTGIISGWGSLKKGEQTADKINGMCVLVKDADTMLQLPNLKQIESEIRDALGDGVIRGEYRTGKEYEIETMFTMIQCGTKVLRSTDNSVLGSRFLDIVIHGEEGSESDETIVRRSIRSQMSAITKALAAPTGPTSGVQRKKSIEALGGPTRGFLQHLKQLIDVDGLKVDSMSKKQETKIYAMADLIAYCRGKVERDPKGHLLFRPEKELATRLAEQLSRLAIFLGVVHLPKNRKTVKLTNQVFSILDKVVRDTAYGFPYEIINAIFEQDRKLKTPLGLPKDRLAVILGVSESHTYSLVQDMREIGILKLREVPNPHGRGRKGHFYVLSKPIQRLCRLAFN